MRGISNPPSENNSEALFEREVPTFPNDLFGDDVEVEVVSRRHGSGSMLDRSSNNSEGSRLTASNLRTGTGGKRKRKDSDQKVSKARISKKTRREDKQQRKMKGEVSTQVFHHNVS